MHTETLDFLLLSPLDYLFLCGWSQESILENSCGKLLNLNMILNISQDWCSICHIFNHYKSQLGPWWAIWPFYILFNSISVISEWQEDYHDWFCALQGSKRIWATALQNQQNDLCAQQRLISAWASVQSDQSIHWPHEKTFGPLHIERTVKTDQPRLINRSLHWAHKPFCWFCHAAIHLSSGRIQTCLVTIFPNFLKFLFVYSNIIFS